MSNSDGERAHWQSVLKAYDGYMQYHVDTDRGQLSANHARRMAFLSLPKESRAIYEELGYREKLEAGDEGIRRNAEFIDEMISDPVFADMLHAPQGENPTEAGPSGSAPDAQSHSHSEPTHVHSDSRGQSHTHSGSHSHSHSNSHKSSKPAGLSSKTDRDHAQDKIRSTLRSFVRDWSEAGAGEREACYLPCLEALQRYFPGPPVQDDVGEEDATLSSRSDVRSRREVKVLVPGCGLARLAMEIAALGFAAQGNEFSAYMLLASHWVLNQTTTANSHVIHPYLHSYSNHLTTENLLRPVQIPDTCPADVLGGGKGGDFSLVAGDFEEVYGGDQLCDGHESKWSAVVTCFFIDCARNVLSYLRIIHALLEDGGVWINIGPLLWHFENTPLISKTGEGSIELSLDEVKSLARRIGFEIKAWIVVKRTTSS